MIEIIDIIEVQGAHVIEIIDVASYSDRDNLSLEPDPEPELSKFQNKQKSGYGAESGPGIITSLTEW